jgi:hypothetical protein
MFVVRLSSSSVRAHSESCWFGRVQTVIDNKGRLSVLVLRVREPSYKLYVRASGLVHLDAGFILQLQAPAFFPRVRSRQED